MSREIMQLTICSAGSLDMVHKSAQIQMVVNEMTVYRKEWSLANMVVPVCVPILAPLQVNLCMSFSQIRFNFEKKCFSSLVTASVQIPQLPELTLYSVPFGYHMEDCASEMRLDVPQ